MKAKFSYPPYTKKKLSTADRVYTISKIERFILDLRLQ